ncbi:polyphosphate kinase 2 [Pelagicoccus sp. SDUM812003]|uniref:polyphosphate kinase 2 n=1 Tax=Pelagicoccus sp. SDUM812003 TaxID=3041267 RepID=UPI00280E2B41|nr:polyphosphate kinase 2 [Pelagicoccus sp. SDUM812003]MDQ8201982.1 polyphosphate kinase 2 [Pelagicoccus sp. SDUM812003]
MPRQDFVKSKFFDFYRNIDYSSYKQEKERLQIELLKLQHWVFENNKRVAIVFEGRDAAGKGSSIKRFIEYMMPKHFRVVELGIPTPSESKYWFRRYEKHFPEPGEIVFFDRSWYNRAMIEPTMGYCKRSQYRYFMSKVLDWEEKHIDNGLILIKLYLSVDKETQLVRFEERQRDPLKYWKYSKNDEKVREYWDVLTKYKNQMFERTSSNKSPWVVIGSNNKLEARLKSMLYVLSVIDYDGGNKFVPLAKTEKRVRYSITIEGVQFNNLNYRQFKLLETLNDLYNA